MIVGIALAAQLFLGQTNYTKEVLVLTTATEMPRSASAHSVEIQNLGPDAIYCAIGKASLAVVGQAHMIAAKPATGPADSWAVDLPPTLKIYCITTVNQLTTAASVVSEK